MSEWKPVGSAPEGVEVLTWQSSARQYTIGRKEGGFWDDQHGTVYGEPPFAPVTHWMELPEPPGDAGVGT